MTDFFAATAEYLRDLGWAKWDTKSNLYLCPASQFARLPDGIALYSISGDVAVKGRDRIDDDTRGGFLAYGIVPGKTRTDAPANAVATRAAVKRAEFVATLASACANGGLIDMATGQVLHGEDAAAAVLALNGQGGTDV